MKYNDAISPLRPPRPQSLAVWLTYVRTPAAGSFRSVECCHFEKERESIRFYLLLSAAEATDYSLKTSQGSLSSAGWFTSSDQFHTNSRRSILRPSARTIKQAKHQASTMVNAARMLPALFWAAPASHPVWIYTFYIFTHVSVSSGAEQSRRSGCDQYWSQRIATNRTINNMFILFFVESWQLCCFVFSFQHGRNKLPQTGDGATWSLRTEIKESRVGFYLEVQ